ncbi:MAG: transposase, partial [Caldimonas sp.]
VIEGAGLSVLEGRSIKAALDIDLGDDAERHEALQRIVAEAELLGAWVQQHTQENATKSPVSDALELLRRTTEQDIEPDPTKGGGVRIREGVAVDRLISISDPEMRHGRKSRSKTIKGYKRHIIIANRIVLGTAVEPANRPEREPTARLFEAARLHGQIVSAQFDRGYLSSPEVAKMWKDGVEIHSRAWGTSTSGKFDKSDFQISVDTGVVACPAGKLARITRSGSVAFEEDDCRRCPIKPHCTDSRRRTLRVHENEKLLIELRAAAARPEGRATYRNRTCVEHRLARITAVQGDKARYRGVRKNEFDLNRAAAVVNLQELSRLRRAS